MKNPLFDVEGEINRALDQLYASAELIQQKCTILTYLKSIPHQHWTDQHFKAFKKVK